MLHFLPLKLERDYFLKSLDDFYFYDDVANEIRIFSKTQIKNRLHKGEHIDGLIEPSRDLVFTEISNEVIYSKEGKPCIVYGPVAMKLDWYTPRFYFSKPVKINDWVNKSQLCFYGQYKDIDFRIDRNYKVSEGEVPITVYLKMLSINQGGHPELAHKIQDDISITLFKKEAVEFLSCLPDKRKPFYNVQLNIGSVDTIFDFNCLSLNYQRKAINDIKWTIASEAKQLILKSVEPDVQYSFIGIDAKCVKRIDCRQINGSTISVTDMQMLESLINRQLIISGGLLVLPDNLELVKAIQNSFSSVKEILYLGEINRSKCGNINQEIDTKHALMILLKGKNPHKPYIGLVTVKEN